MAVLAVVVGIVALTGALVSFMASRAFFRLLAETRDTLKVLDVTICGLEAKLASSILEVRDSSDATVARVDALVKSMDAVVNPVGMESAAQQETRRSAFGRIIEARQLFEKLESDSMAELEKRMKFRG